MLRSALGTLCGAAAWNAIHLDDGDVLLWSSDDQTGAYHVFTMPRGWHKFFVINIFILWRELGIDLEGAVITRCAHCLWASTVRSPSSSTCTDAWVLDHCPQELAFLLAGSGAAMQNFRWILFLSTNHGSSTIWMTLTRPV